MTTDSKAETVGTVYLVGAGPGDPELITVRGQRILQQAEVVIYDRLVPPQLLRQTLPQAELIYAGKSPGHHVLRQVQINTLLIDRARKGNSGALERGRSLGLRSGRRRSGGAYARPRSPTSLFPA